MNATCRLLFACALVFIPSAGAFSEPRNGWGDRHFSQPLDRLAFGSCLNQQEPQPIWAAVRSRDPSAFLFLGDNIYVTSALSPVQSSVSVLEAEYQRLITGEFLASWQRPLLAVWDDNDYGAKDGGAEYALKEESKKLFLRAFRIPTDSPRAVRPGNYESVWFGARETAVQVVLLDTRTFRSPLKTRETPLQVGQGPYMPTDDSRASILGDAQWAWLEKELSLPAQVRVIASSIQVLADEHGYETWGNFPRERDRLLRALRASSGRSVIVSGDRHHAEISRLTVEGEEVWEVTASALNMGRPDIPEPNRYRHGARVLEANFGLLAFNWREKQVVAEIVTQEGAVPLRIAMPFDESKRPSQ